MPNKLSDQIVQPRTVLETVLKLQSGDTQPVLLQLEQTEPDLADYLPEQMRMKFDPDDDAVLVA